MGTELLIPLAATVIGSGAQYYNTRQTAKQQDRIAAQGIRTQAAKQRQADSLVDTRIDEFADSSPDAQREQALTDYLTQLRTARGSAQGTTNVPGASGRYQADTESAGADIQNYGSRAADILSRISAPSRQRQDEAIRTGRLGADLGGVARESSGEDYLTRLRAAGVQRNPWIDAAGQVASSFGQTYATRAPKTPVPTPAPGSTERLRVFS
jgi:hypothetical protein